MRRIICLLLLLCVMLTSAGIGFAEETEKSSSEAGAIPAEEVAAEMGSTAPSTPSTSDKLGLIGASAILIDAATGEILYEKNANEPHYPASMTKVMTAILTLENRKQSDIITVDAETPFTEGSRIYLVEGEQLSVDEMMYGLLLESANDVAVAFAKEISGTTEEFAKLMNKKAKEVGAKNTNFVNPNGLHDAAHVSTAYDMAMIAKYAMKNKAFRKYVSTYQHNIAATDKQDIRYLYNTNRLLYDNVHKVTVNGVQRGCKYEGVTGIKCGYTDQARGCLIAGAERNGTELIAVVMASTNMGRFQDCITLLDYGFENYKTAHVLDADEDFGTVRVRHGEVRSVKVVSSEEVTVTLPSGVSEKLLRTKIKLKPQTAPVKKGQTVGTLVVTDGTQTLRKIDLVAAESVEKGGILSYIGIPDRIGIWIWRGLFGTIGLLFVLLVTYILIKRHQIKVKRRKRAAKRAAEAKAAAERKAQWEEEYWKYRK